MIQVKNLFMQDLVQKRAIVLKMVNGMTNPADVLTKYVAKPVMQKALAGRLPLVAGISAPSSLAVEFSQESNQSLVGFLRAPQYNLYNGAERVATGD